MLVAGACTTALLLGPVAGPAAADDASVAKTITERAQQLDKREKALGRMITSLQRSRSLSRVKAAAKDSGSIYRTTVAFRDEVREDDGSTDKGIQVRDALLPPLTSMAAAAKKLDRQVTSVVRKRRVSKSDVSRIVAAKLVLDRSIGKVVGAIGEAFADDSPTDPAPPPTDPTE